MVSRTIKLKNLNIEPLSVAKYFHDKGIETNSIMQDLLYLSYREILKKENTLLFEEEFQAWEGGPTLHSVFYSMDNYFEKNETYEGLFDKVPSIKNKIVTNHLENIYQQYEKAESQKRTLDFYEKAKDRAWKITRKTLNGNSRSRLIKIATMANSLRL